MLILIAIGIQFLNRDTVARIWGFFALASPLTTVSTFVRMSSSDLDLFMAQTQARMIVNLITFLILGGVHATMPRSLVWKVAVGTWYHLGLHLGRAAVVHSFIEDPSLYFWWFLFMTGPWLLGFIGVEFVCFRLRTRIVDHVDAHEITMPPAPESADGERSPWPTNLVDQATNSLKTLIQTYNNQTTPWLALL